MAQILRERGYGSLIVKILGVNNLGMNNLVA